MFKIPPILITLIVSLCLKNVESAKILGVIPKPAHSHFTVGFKLFKELADRGHNVTVISSYPQKVPIQNYRDIIIDGLKEEVEARKKVLLTLGQKSVFFNIDVLQEWGNLISDMTLSSQGVQKLLKEERFDVVITEEFATPALIGIAAHFNAPNIFLSSVRASIWNNFYFGNPEETAYVPHIMSTLTTQMDFLERLENWVLLTYEKITKHLFFIPAQNDILHKYLPNTPNLETLLYNNSIMLLNTDTSIEDSIPVLPNMIHIGGYHVSDPKPLPKDLKKFMDDAKDGVVYFSMGSNLKSKDMPEEKIEAILKAFSKLKQQVLWKFEDEVLPNKPDNVLISSWFPQSDILAHPNVRVFITHGGSLSITEAVSRGIPVIGIPVFGDQRTNIKNAASKGFGLGLSFKELTEENLTGALNEVLSNPKYTENAKFRSKLINDKPVKPMDLAVFWVEYVIRNGASPHFRSPALNLTWYQRSLLDIALLLTSITVILFIFFYWIIKRIIHIFATGGAKKKID